MEGIRQSIAHNAAIAAHLQAQQQHAQHQAAAAAAAQRNNTLVWQQQQAANNANAAQMQSAYSNFMAIQNSMAHMAMVATAKLAPFKKKGPSNSSLTVRTTVPRLNVAGGIYTVAQWARKCVEDNIEFVTKIARRDDPKANLVMLAYGDGCQTIVFFDDAMNKIPKDLKKIKKIHVGVSTAPIDDKRTGAEMAESGVLQPSDSLWDHLRFEQAGVSKEKKEKIMYIHTSMTVYGESDLGRRRVLQIKTNAPKSPFVAESYMRNVMFEREVLAKWKGEVPGLAPVLAEYPMGATAIAPGIPPVAAAAAAPAEDKDKEYLITFNPKELLLLEKAFDNGLTPRDLKSKAEKWTDDDQKKCQLTILRANNEFKYVFPRKPNRKKSEIEEAKAKKSDAASSKKAAPKSASKAKPATKEPPKKAKATVTKKKDTPAKKKKKTPTKSVKKDPVDSDDEPIVKLKTPAKKGKAKAATPKKTPAKKAEPKKAAPVKKATPAKKATPTEKATPAKKKVVKKEPASSKKRGRDKSPAPPPKKTRSSSKPRTSSRSRK